MKRTTYSLALTAVIALAVLGITARAQRPYRASHEQVKNLIERIEEGTDALRASIKEALDRSRFDDTKPENNINQLVKDFEQAADRLKERFSDDNAAVAAAEEVLRRGAAIDSFTRHHCL